MELTGLGSAGPLGDLNGRVALAAICCKIYLLCSLFFVPASKPGHSTAVGRLVSVSPSELQLSPPAAGLQVWVDVL